MSQESDPGWDTVRIVAPAAVLGGGRGIGRGMRGGAMEALLLDASGVVNFFDVPDRGGERKPLRVVDVKRPSARTRAPTGSGTRRAMCPTGCQIPKARSCWTGAAIGMAGIELEHI